jgi:peroxiredoxin Q/BCP
MKKTLAVGVVTAALGVAWFVWPLIAQQPVPGQPDLKAGDPAPDFTLQASDGKTYSLSKLRGRAVVLAWFPKAFTAG